MQIFVCIFFAIFATFICKLLFGCLVYSTVISAMNNKQRSKEVAHWSKCIKDLEKKAEKRGFMTTDERQQKYLCQSNIEKLYELQ